MKQSFTLEMGAKTCASTPGEFCRMLRSSHFGQKWLCRLYEEPLLEEDNGWLLRCRRCLEEFPIADLEDLPSKEQLLADTVSVLPWLEAAREVSSISLPEALNSAAVDLFITSEVSSPRADRIRKAITVIRAKGRL